MEGSRKSGGRGVGCVDEQNEWTSVKVTIEGDREEATADVTADATADATGGDRWLRSAGLWWTHLEDAIRECCARGV